MPVDTNIDRLIGTLIERTESMGRELHGINMKLDAITNHHEGRVSLIEGRITALEMKWAERAGGNKMAALVFGASATVGGLIATAIGNIGKFWGVS